MHGFWLFRPPDFMCPNCVYARGCVSAVDRSVIAGVTKHYGEEELSGRLAVAICNLVPGTFRGIESTALLFAAHKYVAFTANISCICMVHVAHHDSTVLQQAIQIKRFKLALAGNLCRSIFRLVHVYDTQCSLLRYVCIAIIALAIHYLWAIWECGRSATARQS